MAAWASAELFFSSFRSSFPLNPTSGQAPSSHSQSPICASSFDNPGQGTETLEKWLPVPPVALVYLLTLSTEDWVAASAQPPKMPPNPFLLAADNPSALLALLRDTPSLACQQDDHGYSLLHAAASYNHLGLLRALVNEFSVPVNLRDEDSETALFVVETVEAARLLVEELGIDTALTGDEGLTACEKIQQDGDFPAVADYLAGREGAAAGREGTAQAAVNGTSLNGSLPSVPQGLSVSFGTVNEDEAAGASPDPDFRRRIEELAARSDLDTEAGQAALRQLVEEAVSGEELAQERNVRPRQG